MEAVAKQRSGVRAVWVRFRHAMQASFLARRAFAVYALLGIIVAVATVVRTWDIVNNPPGFFADEASLGYNAYSILHTGKDEHGATMPLFFRAFGEYKLAFFVYAEVPFIALLGMTELAVRLPSALLGVLTVVALFLLVRELTRDEPLALLSAGVLAILPWHIHYTRTGFGNISAHILFLVLGLYFFVLGTRRPWFWLASAGAFALSLYSYRAAWVLLPPLLLIVAIVYRQELLKHWRIAALSLGVLGLACIPILQHTLSVSGDRTQDQWIFALDLGVWDSITRFASQYRDHFTNAFLFDGTAERNLRHVLPGQGWVYTWQIPFLVIGGAALLWRPSKAKALMLGFIAIFPLAAALSVRGPSSNRALFGAAALSIITALGVVTAVRLARDWTQGYGGRALGLALTGVLLAGVGTAASLQFASYLDAYHGRYQQIASGFNGWQWGPSEVIAYFASVEDEYDELFMGSDYNAPSIFFRFYAPDSCRNCGLGSWARYDPEKRQLFALSPNNLARALEYDVKDLLRDPGGRLAFAIVEITGTRPQAPGIAPSLTVGTPGASLDELDRAIAADPNDGQAFAQRGLLHLNEGRYEQAIEDLTRAISLDGQPVSARVNRGNALWRSGDFASAVRDYTSAIELDPALFAAHYNRGNAYATYGDVGRAKRDYSEALKLDPSAAETHSNLAVVFLGLGDVKGALRESDLAVQLDPQLALAYANRGQARWRQSLTTQEGATPDDALDDFERAIDLDPTLALAYARRGEVLLALGSPALAVPDFDRTIELEPDSAAGYSGRGFAYAVTGDYARAAADLDRATELDKDDAMALLRRGVVDLRLGETRAAIDSLREAIQLDLGFVRTAREWRQPSWSLADRRLELRELERAASLLDDERASSRLQSMIRYLRTRV